MTEFRWGDEETPKENPSLERQVATEKDYDEYIINKMNSVERFEELRVRMELAERDDFKEQGFSLQYYKIGEEIYWSTTLKN